MSRAPVILTPGFVSSALGDVAIHNLRQQEAVQALVNAAVESQRHRGEAQPEAPDDGEYYPAITDRTVHDERQLQGRGRTLVRTERKVGRNEPCPCGSGRKYKRCHGTS